MAARLSLTLGIIVFVLALSTCVAPVPTTMPMPAPTSTAAPTPIPGEMQEARVLRVVDGDTIAVELEGKRYSVRYIGIDTPETHHPTDGADYWGFEATEANQALVHEGARVVLQRDISETDVYGRLLRYVFVDDVLVNAELVRMGLARVLFYEPDVRYRTEIKAAEAEAQAAKRGLYGPVPTPPAVQPLLHRGSAWTLAAAGRATVGLRYDPARGEPVMSFPAGMQVRVVDAFWVPEEQEWWYWIGVEGFNGWVTGEAISRRAPSEEFPGPSENWAAYDWVQAVDSVSMYVLPGSTQIVGSLSPGTPMQLKRVSWDPRGGWWYYGESTQGEGWVAPDLLE